MTITIYQSQGYSLSFNDSDIDMQYNHIFCGENKVVGAFCPNCKKPLLKFLTIDMAYPILSNNPSNIKYLHFLFCWTCNIAQRDFSYQIMTSNEVRILKYEKGGAMSDFPYESYPLFFPEKKVGFKKIEKNWQKLIADINKEAVDIYDYIDEFPDITTPQHQVGGEPLLRQDSLEDFKCPKCGEIMPLLASISDSHPDNMSFSGNSYVQILYFLCARCSVVGARQFCD